MSINSARSLVFGAGALATALVLFVACSSSTTSTPAGTEAGASCASPGAATPGKADTHCQGMAAQPVDPGSCHPDAAAVDGGTGDDDSCPYGDTAFGQSSNDDDCKYQLSWTSDPICEGAGGVQFTVTVKSNVDGTPVSDSSGLIAEAFIPTSLTATCDNQSTHPAPGDGTMLETAPGTGVYKGAVIFDAPGEWTVRFHIHEECADLLPTSQHGHAAYHVTVP